MLNLFLFFDLTFYKTIFLVELSFKVCVPLLRLKSRYIQVL